MGAMTVGMRVVAASCALALSGLRASAGDEGVDSAERAVADFVTALEARSSSTDVGAFKGELARHGEAVVRPLADAFARARTPSVRVNIAMEVARIPGPLATSVLTELCFREPAPEEDVSAVCLGSLMERRAEIVLDDGRLQRLLGIVRGSLGEIVVARAAMVLCLARDVDPSRVIDAVFDRWEAGVAHGDVVPRGAYVDRRTLFFTDIKGAIEELVRRRPAAAEVARARCGDLDAARPWHAILLHVAGDARASDVVLRIAEDRRMGKGLRWIAIGMIPAIAGDKAREIIARIRAAEPAPEPASSSAAGPLDPVVAATEAALRAIAAEESRRRK